MSNTPTSNSASSSRGSPDFDREQAFGEFLRTSRWRDDLNRRFTHKALDIPEDDVNATVTNTTNGFGWRELLALAAVVGVGLVAAAILLRPAPTPIVPVPVPGPGQAAPPATDADTWFELRLVPDEPGTQ